jgi:hypothetical protein
MNNSTFSTDFMVSGVPSNSVLDLFSVKFRSGRPEMIHSLASDGAHVFMQTSQGLFKVGSGYAGTIKVKIILSLPAPQL